ncbi:MAG TPA: methyltransferase domain-containing protein [bacterium]|nr:methyltransferase domain-containing protein [bacterium]
MREKPPPGESRIVPVGKLFGENLVNPWLSFDESWAFPEKTNDLGYVLGQKRALKVPNRTQLAQEVMARLGAAGIGDPAVRDVNAVLVRIIVNGESVDEACKGVIEAHRLAGRPAAPVLGMKVPGSPKAERLRSAAAMTVEDARAKIPAVSVDMKEDGTVVALLGDRDEPVAVEFVERPGDDADFAQGAVDPETGMLRKIRVSGELHRAIMALPEYVRVKAYTILVRHEFVEGELGQTHELASAVDADIEKSAYHALMSCIIPLMSDPQLCAIDYAHANDPEHEVFYAALQELAKRAQKTARTDSAAALALYRDIVQKCAAIPELRDNGMAAPVLELLEKAGDVRAGSLCELLGAHLVPRAFTGGSLLRPFGKLKDAAVKLSDDSFSLKGNAQASIIDSNGGAHTVNVKKVAPKDVTQMLRQMQSGIERMDGISDQHKAFVQALARIVERSPPRVYTFPDIIEDFSFASGTKKCIGLNKFFAGNPVAVFHAVSKYLVVSGAMTLKFDPGKNALIVALNGKEEEIPLDEEALAIVRGGLGRPHYLLRALQRQMFGSQDALVTDAIRFVKRLKIDFAPTKYLDAGTFDSLIKELVLSQADFTAALCAVTGTGKGKIDINKLSGEVRVVKAGEGASKMVYKMTFVAADDTELDLDVVFAWKKEKDLGGIDNCEIGDLQTASAGRYRGLRLVPVFGVSFRSEDERRIFIEEFIKGDTAAAYMENGTMDEGMRRNIAATLLMIGLVLNNEYPRDMHEFNFIITPEGRAVMIDLGSNRISLARAMAENPVDYRPLAELLFELYLIYSSREDGGYRFIVDAFAEVDGILAGYAGDEKLMSAARQLNKYLKGAAGWLSGLDALGKKKLGEYLKTNKFFTANYKKRYPEKFEEEKEKVFGQFMGNLDAILRDSRMANLDAEQGQRAQAMLASQLRPYRTYSAQGILEPLKLGPDDVYLDLAGGPGTASAAASAVAGKVVYVDISSENIPLVKELLEYAGNPDVLNVLNTRPGLNVNVLLKDLKKRTGIARAPASNVDVLRGDARRLPLGDNSVTKLSVTDLFRWVSLQGGGQDVIREILRVVRDGGLVHIRYDYKKLAQQLDIAAVAREMGIRVEVVQDQTAIGGTVYRVLKPSPGAGGPYELLRARLVAARLADGSAAAKARDMIVAALESKDAGRIAFTLSAAQLDMPREGARKSVEENIAYMLDERFDPAAELPAMYRGLLGMEDGLALRQNFGSPWIGLAFAEKESIYMSMAGSDMVMQDALKTSDRRIDYSHIDPAMPEAMLPMKLMVYAMAAARAAMLGLDTVKVVALDEKSWAVHAAAFGEMKQDIFRRLGMSAAQQEEFDKHFKVVTGPDQKAVADRGAEAIKELKDKAYKLVAVEIPEASARLYPSDIIVIGDLLRFMLTKGGSISVVSLEMAKERGFAGVVKAIENDELLPLLDEMAKTKTDAIIQAYRSLGFQA